MEGGRLHPTTLQIQPDSPDFDILLQIRSIYLPFIILWLQSAYYQSREAHPTYLEASMDLVRTIADEDKGLYQTLVEARKLEEFLQILRNASVATLVLDLASNPRTRQTAELWRH